MKTENMLTEAEERLLMKYHDEACGFWGRQRVEWLLQRSAPARDFLKGLSVIGECSRIEQEQCIPGNDLWDRISARITQEERTELFLGKRSQPASQSRWGNFVESFGGSVRMAAGFSGAVAAALLLAVFLPQQQGPSQNAVARAGTSEPLRILESGELSPDLLAPSVDLATDGGGVAPRSGVVDASGRRMLLPRIVSPVEVDWVRSDGRVRMMHDSSASAPIIWVYRNPTFPRQTDRGIYFGKTPIPTGRFPGR